MGQIQASNRWVLLRGAATAVLLVAAGFGLGSYFAAPRPPSPALEPAKPAAQIAAPSAVREATPAPEPPLERRDLIAAAAAAADAYAAGLKTVPANAALIGRRFEIEIAFGCYGPVTEGASAPLHWTYDAEDKALRLNARPSSWAEASWVSQIAGGSDFEAVEGFWIPRPWVASETCPPPAAMTGAPMLWPAPRDTLAIAQFFSAGGSRAQQRDGKPYGAVIKVEPDDLTVSKGFHLVVRGRIDKLPRGEPVWCYSESADYRPICLIAAEIEYVAFKNPETGDVLSEWRR